MDSDQTAAVTATAETADPATNLPLGRAKSTLRGAFLFLPLIAAKIDIRIVILDCADIIILVSIRKNKERGKLWQVLFFRDGSRVHTNCDAPTWEYQCPVGDSAANLAPTRSITIPAGILGTVLRTLGDGKVGVIFLDYNTDEELFVNPGDLDLKT